MVLILEPQRGIDTWEEEFYPTEAYICSKRNAAAHSLRKWIGLTKKNLAKHNLCKAEGILAVKRDPGFGETLMAFWVDGDACALCHHFYDISLLPICKSCPVFKVNKGKSCLGAYEEWAKTGNIRPMLRLLRKAVAWSKEHIS